MKIKKVNIGIYKTSFPIRFKTQQALNGSIASDLKNGIAEVEIFETGFNDKDLKWGYSLTIVNKAGDTLYTERDPYPSARKKDVIADLQLMAKSRCHIFYY